MTESSSSQMPAPDSTAARTLAWALDHGVETWFARETTSTNTIAKSKVSLLSSPMKPAVYLTESQTAGRGRGHHTWSTPENALLSSWLFPLTFTPQPILSPLTGLALFRAARQAFSGIAFNLKAPNDLYVGHQKIAGILIESIKMGDQVTCVIGLGFNAGLSPSGLGDAAVGLRSLISETTIAERWPMFISGWFDGINSALQESHGSELSNGSRADLLEALNLHSLPEKILEVGSRGQLRTATRLIDWYHL